MKHQSTQVIPLLRRPNKVTVFRKIKEEIESIIVRHEQNGLWESCTTVQEVERQYLCVKAEKDTTCSRLYCTA